MGEHLNEITRPRTSKVLAIYTVGRFFVFSLIENFKILERELIKYMNANK